MPISVPETESTQFDLIFDPERDVLTLDLACLDCVYELPVSEWALMFRALGFDLTKTPPEEGSPDAI